MNEKIEMNEMMELSMKSHMTFCADTTTTNKAEKLNSIKKGLKNLMMNGEWDKARMVFNAASVEDAFNLI